MRFGYRALAVCVLVLLPSVAQARDPLTLTASSSSQSVTVSGNNIVDLANNVVESKGEFASLSGQDVTASLSYGKLENAIVISRNAAGTSATLSIPSTGFSKTYTAANQDELHQQIEDDLKQGGLNTYSKFLSVVNEETNLGVTDGNPLSLTALFADSSFYRFGFQPTKFEGGTGTAIPKGLSFYVSGGSSSSVPGDGYYADAGIGTTFAFGDRLGLSISLDGRYRDVGGAKIYEVVNTDALPIVLIAPGEDGMGLTWTVTPAFVIGVGWSTDLVAGGLPIGGQVTSSLAYRKGAWTFLMANQYGAYTGTNVDIGDYTYDTEVDQQIVKNGFQVIYTFGGAFVDAGIAYTNLLQDAAVDAWWSPEVGVGVKIAQYSSLRLGYHGDFGDGFDDNGANLTLFLSY